MSLPLAPDETKRIRIPGVYGSEWDAKIAAEDRIREMSRHLSTS